MKGKLVHWKIWVVGFVFLFVFGFSNSTAAAAELEINHLNQTLTGEVTTTVYLNYCTPRTSSSSAPQPATRVYYYLEGETFDQDTTAYIPAQATVYDRIAYHKATISGLQAGRTYQYKIYDTVSKTFSKEYSFTTKAAEVEEFSFIATADANYRSTVGYQNNYGNTLKKAVTQTPDAAFIVHTGKANSSLASQTHWDGFFEQGSGVLENYPIVPSTISTGTTNRFFQLNYNLSYTNYELNNYSFVYGEMLFLSINSKLTSTANINSHISWLKSEIAARGQNKWIVVSIGDSFYGAASNATTIKTQLNKAFRENGVALVIQGNDNAYTRSVPIDGANVLTAYSGDDEISTKDGIIYLSPGASGVEQSNGNTGRNWLKEASNFSSSATNKAADKKMYTKVTVDKNRLLVTAYTADGEVFDNFEINRKATPIGELDVENLNQTLIGDITTSARLNYHTPAAASSSDPQSKTKVYYYKAGESFDMDKTAAVDGEATKYSSYTYHKATITGLEPNQKYHYRIFDTGYSRLSKEYTFETAAAEEAEFSFIATADANYRSTAGYQNYYGNTLKTAVSQTPEAAFIVHTGKANSSLAAESYWEGFFDQGGTVLEEYPIVPSTISTGTTNRFFQLNYNLDYTSYDLNNYSFVYGDMLFLSINSKLTSTANINAHITWLQNEMRTRGKDKWIVVSIGDSFYGTGTNTTTIKTRLNAAFREGVDHNGDGVKDNQVALVIQGNDNAYTRSNPIDYTNVLYDYAGQKTVATKDGIVYLSPGASGVEQANGNTGRNWIRAASNFSSSSVNKLAEKKMYTKVTVKDDQLLVTAYTVDGEVLDDFEINRGETPEREPKELTFTALNNAFGGDAKSTRTITWQTDKTMSAAAVEIVEDGEAFTKENIDLHEGSTTSNTGNIIFTSKATNKVALDSLKAGVTYQYRLRNSYVNPDTKSVTYYYSSVYDFTTEAEDVDSYTFLNVADSQGGSTSYEKFWRNTLSQALNKYPQAPFVIQAGDMVDSINDTHYTNYFAATGDLLSSAAFAPVLGNHEGKTAEKFYNSVFSLEAVNGYPLNYSFSYGNALYFNLNANYDTKANLEKQAEWMQRVAAQSEHKGKFIIVTFHKNPYGGRWTSQTSGVLASRNIKTYLYPVMEEMGVSLVLSGHDHNYIRSFPVKNGTQNTAITDHKNISTGKDGLINMVTRNSGEKTYDLVSTSGRPWIDVLWQPSASSNLPENTMFAAITVTDDKLEVSAMTSGYTVIDNYTITK